MDVSLTSESWKANLARPTRKQAGDADEILELDGLRIARVGRESPGSSADRTGSSTGRTGSSTDRGNRLERRGRTKLDGIGLERTGRHRDRPLGHRAYIRREHP